jgi:hypothetical protein
MANIKPSDFREIPLSSIRHFSAPIVKFQNACLELQFEAKAKEGKPTLEGLRLLLMMHPIGVVAGNDAESYTLVHGIRSFQIAACCAKTETPIIVRVHSQLSDDEIIEYALVDLILSNHLYSYREQYLSFSVPMILMLKRRAQLHLLDKLVMDCQNISDLAKLYVRGPSTLRNRAVNAKSDFTGPELPPSGLSKRGATKLIELHPVGTGYVKKSNRRVRLFGWRTSRVVSSNMQFLANPPPPKYIGQLSEEEAMQFKIADILLSANLYSLRTSAVSSVTYLYEYLQKNGYEKALLLLAPTLNSLESFANFFGRSHDAFRMRSQKTAEQNNRA